LDQSLPTRPATSARAGVLTDRAVAGTVSGVSADADRGIVVDGARDLAGAPRRVAAVAGRIVVSEPTGAGVRIDAEGLGIAPGYVDLQVNGAAGIDLTSQPERLWEVASALPRYGVTTFLPTIVTSPPEVVERALEALSAGPPPGWVGARPLGLHLEGPMIAPNRRGAHVAAHIVAPAASVIAGWSARAGVAMVTLAPELPGAAAIARELTDRGIVVSAGHTDADASTAREAVAAGVRAVTHLFNAMRRPDPHESGLAGAVLAGLPVVAGLIADGAHIDPDLLRAAWTALGSERRMLVSDATAALGAPPGPYRLGDLTIVGDGVRSLDPATGRPAGSASGIDAGVRTVMGITGCDVSAASAAASATPARLLGRSELGSLGAGTPADLVLLDADLHVVVTVVAGVVAYRRDPG
jgi:N-acetylglucosamine-6-phosphate deacetylase